MATTVETDPDKKFWTKAQVRRLMAYVGLVFTLAIALSLFQSRLNRAEDAAQRATDKAAFVEEAAQRDADAQKVKDHNDCLSSNLARTGIRQAFIKLLDQAVAASVPDPNRTPEEQAARDAAFEKFKQDFLAENLDKNLPIVNCDEKFPVKTE